MQFKRIMVPVDLAHIEKLEGALSCAADLARHYDIPITYVGVTGTAPSSIAHNPTEFGQKLEEFSKAEGVRRGVAAAAYYSVANDPTAEVDDALLRAIQHTKSDFVVMASHLPGVFDHIWPSNGGKLAEHAKCSVMLVRL
ncbi:universal stress protein [Aquicoccus sp. G2-2]|uniref:universal stress protein n=1 Tax=Aquicoccus sp. G2-2 TaxID=3092120 RepID=UPI002ADF26FA|nr:universal stress protein [Aquicoccus sp. G2-2]MEA1114288.1 universal stress protein [Aquicoccus sp. G2-2]